MADRDYVICPIIINGSDTVQNGSNNIYRYRFPQAVAFQGAKIAVGSVSMYYSWFNISSNYANNAFSFIFPGSGTSVTTYNVTIPDGYYSVSGLNSYLQQFFIQNGLYLIDGSGNYVYYMEFVENPTYYGVQFNSYPVSTSLPSGYTNPASMPFPSTAKTPLLVVPSTNFRNLIGFNAGTYPSTAQATTYSKLSDYTPQVSPTQSIILTCSLLANKFANPSTALYSFSAAGVSFGSIIQSNPNEHSYVDIVDGNYTEFTISFLDQSFNSIQLNDSNLVVQLLIKFRDS